MADRLVQEAAYTEIAETQFEFKCQKVATS